MQEVLLKVRVREGTGKKYSHKIRAKGEIPGILYGHGKENVPLSVPEHDLWHILHHSTSEHIILSLEIEGSSEGRLTTLLRDVQHHPVTGDILHVDFQRISKDEAVKVDVPIELVGQPKGVKDFGGVLDHTVREVTIKCKPLEIPEILTLDVSHLEIGDSIHVSDLAVAYPNLEILDDPTITIAHVSPPKKLEVAEKLEEEAAAAEEAEEKEEEEEAEPESEEKSE